MVDRQTGFYTTMTADIADYIPDLSGGSEGVSLNSTTSVLEDLKYLLSVKTYVFLTLGNTGIAFFQAALTWWFPDYCINAVKVYEVAHGEGSSVVSKEIITQLFGLILTVASLVAVPLGVVLSRTLSPKLTHQVDQWISGLGTLVAIPFILATLFLFDTNIVASLVLLFLGIVFFSLGIAVQVK